MQLIGIHIIALRSVLKFNYAANSTLNEAMCTRMTEATKERARIKTRELCYELNLSQYFTDESMGENRHRSA